MTNLKVSLGDRSYPIKIGNGAFGAALNFINKICASRRKVVCVADSSVAKAHKSAVENLALAGASIVEIAGGESTKSMGNLESLYSRFAQSGLDRKSCVVALGGGVIGDLSGFAAATYMRGIDFCQIPTTLLAMVDSSVGGKTGVNIAEGKNLVGAFHQPVAVFADTDFLRTLPKREFAAGMAEVIKCAVLGDAKLFKMLENLARPLSPVHENLPDAIRRCCVLKAKIVSEDERETNSNGGRALLNFGHTFGHAVENCAGYGTYLHGEAVSIGMAFAARLSVALGNFTEPDCRRLESLLKRNKLPVSLSQKLGAEQILRAMSHDKKASGGEIRFVLADAIGESKTSKVDAEFLKSEVAKFLK